MQNLRFSLIFLASLYFCSLSIHAEQKTITNQIYSEKGLAGKQVMKQVGDNQFEGTLDLGWNNRVVQISEKVTVNKQGRPINYSAEGVSAFGAPIKEHFTLQDGIASWESFKDDGQLEATDNYFYMPGSGAVVADNLLVKAMLNSMTKSVDLLPSGTARLTELKKITLSNGDHKNTVYLYAISGLNFSPTFAWYDSDGNFFAQDYAGFMRIIREGYSLENFEQLRELQKDAEQAYLEDIADRLSHSYSTLLIKNVNVVDVENSAVQKGMDVLLMKGKIAEIGQKLSMDNSVPIIDGTGKTLLPALWDMHGHLSKNDGLLNMAAGVVNVRDIGNNHKNIMEIEQLFNSNTLIGNNVYRAGFFDQMSEFSAGLSVSSLEEAHEKIDWFADNGYIQIKLYSSIDPSWVKPIAEHTHRRGMRLSGHIPAFMTAEQAVHAGYDEIQHINMLFLNFLAGTEVDTRKQLRFSLIGEEAGKLDLDSKAVNDFIKLLADKQIVIDVTVSTFRSLLLKENKKVDPEFASISSHLPPNVLRRIKGAEMNVAPELEDDYQAGADALVKLVKKLYDNGVPIVPGTDNIAGFTLHRELEVYEEAGIPNLDILKIASLNSAKLVGAAHYTGSISQGKVADLILVDGDPTKKMSDIRKIALVVKGNHFYKPDELYQVLGVKPFVVSSKFKQ